MSLAVQMSWKSAWQQPIFKKYLLIGLVLLVIVLSILPFFFIYIETINGATLHDPILNYLTPKNVSVYIFTIIWSMALLTIVRNLKILNFFSYCVTRTCRNITGPLESNLIAMLRIINTGERMIKDTIATTISNIRLATKLRRFLYKRS